jgi:hypothetical protein
MQLQYLYQIHTPTQTVYILVIQLDLLFVNSSWLFIFSFFNAYALCQSGIFSLKKLVPCTVVKMEMSGTWIVQNIPDVKQFDIQAVIWLLNRYLSDQDLLR